MVFPCSVTQNLHPEAVATKCRKIFVVVLITVISGMVAYGLLKRQNEPKYQGRYLSEWLEKEWLDKSQRSESEYWESGKPDAEVEVAVRSIGTNALPHLMKLIADQPPEWRYDLGRKLPAFITTRAPFAGWLGADLNRRRSFGCIGLTILGTNAVSVIPELQARLKSATNSGYAYPDYAFPGQIGLASIGAPAIPALKAAFTDPNQPNRYVVIYALRSMAYIHRTNFGLPILMEALDDDDVKVRSEATNAILAYAPHLLTNAPAK